MKRLVRVAALLVLAAALLYLLSVRGGLSIATIVQTCARVSLPTLICLGALLGANLALCALKWLVAMRALAPDQRTHPGFLDAMLATTLGALLGQIMPFQLGVGLARAAAGFSGVGSPGVNLGTTFYEQLFDLIVLAAAAAVGAAGLTLHAGTLGWPFLALAGGGASVVAALRLAWLLTTAARLVGFALMPERYRRLAATLIDAAGQAAHTPPSVLLRLLALSGVRYAASVAWVLGLLAALRLSADAGRVAAAFPLTQIIACLPFTPGGLGVIEWTWSAVMVWAGASLGAAALFAVAARVFGALGIALLLVPLALLRAIAAICAWAIGHSPPLRRARSRDNSRSAILE
jgi:uncharacterized membrane protein YbhN (UPF0104 family)